MYYNDFSSCISPFISLSPRWSMPLRYTPIISYFLRLCNKTHHRASRVGQRGYYPHPRQSLYRCRRMIGHPSAPEGPVLPHRDALPLREGRNGTRLVKDLVGDRRPSRVPLGGSGPPDAGQPAGGRSKDSRLKQLREGPVTKGAPLL